jgi:hypothetical protein
MNKNFRLHMISEEIKKKDRKKLSKMILINDYGDIDINDNTITVKKEKKGKSISLKKLNNSLIIDIVEILDILGIKIISNKNNKIIIDHE